jgi:hypothetical protein
MSGGMMDLEDKPQSFEELTTLYKIYRDYIENEDRLLNERTNRFLASQSVLFAAYGALAYEKLKSLIADPSREVIEIVPKIKSFFVNYDLNFLLHINLALLPIYLIGAFGIVAAYISLVSMNAARRAVDKLEQKWQVDVLGKRGATSKLLPNMTGGGDRYAHGRGWMHVHILPELTILAWVLIIVLHSAYVK